MWLPASNIEGEIDQTSRELTRLAQSVERSAFNRVVVGSIPTSGASTGFGCEAQDFLACCYARFCRSSEKGQWRTVALALQTSNHSNLNSQNNCESEASILYSTI